MLEVKPTSRQADLQDLPRHLPARIVAKGFRRLCPAAVLLACLLANQRLTLPCHFINILPSETRGRFTADMALRESCIQPSTRVMALQLHRGSGCPWDLSFRGGAGLEEYC